MTREEAINKVRWGLMGLVINKDVRDAFETLIPELRESEDERMMKNIRLAILSVDDAFWRTHGLTAKEAISYLEKQKEQKPTEWSKEDEEKINDISEIIEHCISIPYCGGTLTLSKEFKKELKCFIESLCPQPKQEWSKEDEEMIEHIVGSLDSLKHYVQDNNGFSENIKESVLKRIEREQDWIKSLRPQSKAEWNEDDEQYLLICKNALSKYQRSDQWDANIISNWLENRLKSIRPSWKPSEAQMYSLKYFIKLWGGFR